MEKAFSDNLEFLEKNTFCKKMHQNKIIRMNDNEIYEAITNE